MGIKRILGFVGVAAAVSIVLNVMVAWTAALLTDTATLPSEKVDYKTGYSEYLEFLDDSGLNQWSVITKSGFASIEIHTRFSITRGAKESDFDGSTEPIRDALPEWTDGYLDYLQGSCSHSIGRGWPWFALATDQVREINRPANRPVVYNRVALKEARTGWVLESVPWDSGRPRVLPTRILWNGFLANTAIYLAIILMPIGIRLLCRRWKGRCMTCGYDLRGQYDRGCSECGWNRPPDDGVKIPVPVSWA